MHRAQRTPLLVTLIVTVASLVSWAASVADEDMAKMDTTIRIEESPQ